MSTTGKLDFQDGRSSPLLPPDLPKKHARSSSPASRGRLPGRLQVAQRGRAVHEALQLAAPEVGAPLRQGRRVLGAVGEALGRVDLDLQPRQEAVAAAGAGRAAQRDGSDEAAAERDLPLLGPRAAQQALHRLCLVGDLVAVGADEEGAALLLLLLLLLVLVHSGRDPIDPQQALDLQLQPRRAPCHQPPRAPRQQAAGCAAEPQPAPNLVNAEAVHGAWQLELAVGVCCTGGLSVHVHLQPLVAAAAAGCAHAQPAASAGGAGSGLAAHQLRHPQCRRRTPFRQARQAHGGALQHLLRPIRVQDHAPRPWVAAGPCQGSGQGAALAARGPQRPGLRCDARPHQQGGPRLLLPP
mmetsp:Transcript_23698/g.67767  ORF Transcript_23698/g.67767 Transcript_23698/m.67767 type:complete len:354 (-) Transcript_23698:1061-2122(-)